MSATQPTLSVEIDFTTDLGASRAYYERLLGTGPYVYHRLQETSGTTAADASGNAVTGTYVGTYTLNQTTAKPISGETASRYVLLDGGGGGSSPGRVNFAAPAPAPDRQTLMGWVRMNGLDGSPSTSYVVFENDGSVAASDLFQLIVQGDGKVKATVGLVSIVTDAAQVPADVFKHVTVTLDGPNQTGSIFINGAVVASTTTISSGGTWGLWITTPLPTWRWGTDVNTATVSPVDRLAEPAYWTRILSATEIDGIYDAATSVPFTGHVWTKVDPWVFDKGGLTRSFGREGSFDEVRPLQFGFLLNNNDRRFEPEYGPTINLVGNPSFEVDTSGWLAAIGTETLARTTAQFQSGVASLSVTTVASANSGVYNSGGPVLTSGVTYTASVYVKAPVSESMNMWMTRSGGFLVGSSAPFTATGGWQRVTVTFTPTTTEAHFINVRHTTASVVVFYVDAAQIETGYTANAYVDTVGTGGSPYYPNVVPGRPCRIRLTQDAVTYDWAFGFIDDFPQVWDDAGKFCTVQISASCRLEQLNGTEMGSRNLVEQLAGARVDAILNSANVLGADRDIDAGAFTIMEQTIEQGMVGDHLRQVARTDRGLFFFDGGGDAVFHDGNHRTSDARSTAVQGRFGPGGIPYRSPQFHAPKSLIRNDFSLRRPGGIDQIANDPSSIGKHGQRSYQDELLLTTDALVAARANALLALYATPTLRVKSVTFNPGQGAGHWAHSLGVKLSDRYTWEFNPASGTMLSRPVFVEGVTDSWRGGEYLSTWFLSVVS